MGTDHWPDWLRKMSDTELLILVEELEQRWDMFDAKLRSVVNDELRRRSWPLLEKGARRRG